jgi:hypothetical protein
MAITPSKSGLVPSARETSRRDDVLAQIRVCIRGNKTIRLPAFDPSLGRGEERFALMNIGREPNDFCGTVGDYRYQFEGEEDLLHLIVTTDHGRRLTPEEGQAVAAFLLDGVPPSLVWLRPGEFSQHFYLGHELVLTD